MGRNTLLLLFLLSAVNGQTDVGRLPRHAIPVSYELDIIIVGFVEFDGFFSILLEVDASTQDNGRITLNSIGLDIDEGRLSIVDAETGEEYQVGEGTRTRFSKTATTTLTNT